MIGRMGKVARPIASKEQTTTQNSWWDECDFVQAGDWWLLVLLTFSPYWCKFSPGSHLVQVLTWWKRVRSGAPALTSPFSACRINTFFNNLNLVWSVKRCVFKELDPRGRTVRNIREKKRFTVQGMPWRYLGESRATSIYQQNFLQAIVDCWNQNTNQLELGSFTLGWVKISMGWVKTEKSWIYIYILAHHHYNIRALLSELLREALL